MHRAVALRVEEPVGKKAPLVVEVPHASIAVDPEALAWLVAPARALGRDADLFVDELYSDAPSLGATLVVGEINRYVCDLNRAEADVDMLSVAGASGRGSPHGLIWRRTTEGEPALSSPVPVGELRRRVDRYHRPYHATLERLLLQIREQFGYAILLCAHSMPSRGRPGNADAGRPRADIVPGSRGGTTASPSVIAVPEELAGKRGWKVVHDDPYRGGYSTGHYGQPERGVHALQVEISRARYMDEASLEKTDGFAEIQGFCRELVARLCKLVP